MENYSNKDIFNLSVDEHVRSHLLESGRWGKFLSIIGYIGCVFMLIAAFAMPAILGMSPVANPYAEQIGYAYTVIFIVFAVLYFFPVHFLFKFSTGIKRAMNNNSQDELVAALSSQRKMFKFVGILTIIGLAFYGLFIIFAVLAATMFRT